MPENKNERERERKRKGEHGKDKLRERRGSAIRSTHAQHETKNETMKSNKKGEKRLHDLGFTI